MIVLRFLKYYISHNHSSFGFRIFGPVLGDTYPYDILKLATYSKFKNFEFSFRHNTSFGDFTTDALFLSDHEGIMHFR